MIRVYQSSEVTYGHRPKGNQELVRTCEGEYHEKRFERGKNLALLEYHFTQALLLPTISISLGVPKLEFFQGSRSSHVLVPLLGMFI